MKITLDKLTNPKVLDLLQIHAAESQAQNPGEVSHRLNVEALRHDSISFWTVWGDENLMGCGALKEIKADHGEIKSMHTAKAHRRKGVSTALLNHIISEAKDRGYARVSLETHPSPGYAPARKLYEGYGFKLCAPFGDYEDNPNSVFMTLDLRP